MLPAVSCNDTLKAPLHRIHHLGPPLADTLKPSHETALDIGPSFGANRFEPQNSPRQALGVLRFAFLPDTLMMPSLAAFFLLAALLCPGTAALSPQLLPSAGNSTVNSSSSSRNLTSSAVACSVAGDRNASIPAGDSVTLLHYYNSAVLEFGVQTKVIRAAGSRLLSVDEAICLPLADWSDQYPECTCFFSLLLPGWLPARCPDRGCAGGCSASGLELQLHPLHSQWPQVP